MANPDDSTRFSLRRWSQRKLEATRSGEATREVAVAPGCANLRQPETPDAATPRDPSSAAPPVDLSTPVRVVPATAPAAGDGSAVRPPELPPLDSLTIDSDYTAFLRPGVDDSVKCGALKKLFSDPRFNVMDGLDVYIDDYSKPSPIDPAIVRTLMQARYIFNPPPTRVTAQGHVEDVPEPAEGGAVEVDAHERGQPGAEVPSLPDAEIATIGSVEATGPSAAVPQPALRDEGVGAKDVVTAAGRPEAPRRESP